MPLLRVPDKAVNTKLLVDDILEVCGPEGMDSDDPRAVYSGMSNKVFPAEFKLLKRGLAVDVIYKMINLGIMSKNKRPSSGYRCQRGTLHLDLQGLTLHLE